MKPLLDILTVCLIVCFFWMSTQALAFVLDILLDTVGPYATRGKKLLEPISSFYRERIQLHKPDALPLRSFPEGNVLYTWEDWHKDNKKEHPVRYFITETLPLQWRIQVSNRIDAVLYWARCHTYDRYHLLDIRNPEYDWGWVDQDRVILYAAFNALKDFVEKEDGLTGWSAHSDEDRENMEEIRSLYVWWTQRRWEDKAKYDRALEAGNFLVAVALEEDMYAEDNRMLHRLVDVRQLLWT